MALHDDAGPQKPPPNLVSTASKLTTGKAIPGRFIAIFKDNAKAEDVIKEVVKGRGQVKYQYTGALKGVAFEVAGGDAVGAQTVATLRTNKDIAFIVPDYEVRRLGAAGRYNLACIATDAKLLSSQTRCCTAQLHSNGDTASRC
jgi:hypothetical protein